MYSSRRLHQQIKPQPERVGVFYLLECNDEKPRVVGLSRATLSIERWRDRAVAR